MYHLTELTHFSRLPPPSFRSQGTSFPHSLPRVFVNSFTFKFAAETIWHIRQPQNEIRTKVTDISSRPSLAWKRRKRPRLIFRVVLFFYPSSPGRGNLFLLPNAFPNSCLVILCHWAHCKIKHILLITCSCFSDAELHGTERGDKPSL